MSLRPLARIACVTALAVAALIACARPARAGEDPATKIAKHHFYAGEKLFALGRFADALKEYEAAFDAKPLPAFLFNIGQCHRNLHDYDAAIFSYRKYVSLLPDAPNRAEVEDLIRELEDAQAREKAEADQRETDRARAATSEPDGGHPIYTRWWLWTGVGVVAAGTATYFLTRDRGVPTTDLGNVAFPQMKPAAFALVLIACGRGVEVTVVTVDARPSVHAASTLAVDVGNASSTFTQSFDLHGHAFPTTFSVTTPGRSGDITFTARALDDTAAVVGIGSTTTTLSDDETDVSLLLDPADFPVNTEIAGAQRTVFYNSTGARQITALPDGTFTTAWSDDCGTLARCDEWGRRFDKTGTPLTTQIAAGTAQFNFNRTDVFGTDAALAAGPDGSVLAVWTTYDEVNGGPGNIICSAIAPDGSAASPTEVVLSDGTLPDHPGITAFKDTFLVVWQEDLKSNGMPAIQLRFIDKTCTTQSQVLTLATGAAPAPDQPALATTLDGTMVAIIWRNGSVLHGRFVTGSSALGVDGTVLSVGADELWGAEISPMDGGFAIVYGLKTTGGALPDGGYVLHRIREGGGDLGVETIIATNTPDDISVAAIARRTDGALAVAWHDCTAAADGMGCGVLAQVLRPTGLPVGAPIVVDTTTTGDQTDASIAALPDAFAAVWTDASMVAPDTSMTGIRARVLYPAYDDAHAVIGAPCSAADPCATGLVCAAGTDKIAHCHATCDPNGAPPLCPRGGGCAQTDAGAACIF